VELFNPKVVQATMGAIFRVDFHYVDIQEFSSSVLKQGGKVYGTFLDGQDIYSRDIDPGVDKPVAIVIGNEANGLDCDVKDRCSQHVTIKMSGNAESLNAAMASGILMWELVR
jgi:TrmH family RNA methyltransferase